MPERRTTRADEDVAILAPPGDDLAGPGGTPSATPEQDAMAAAIEAVPDRAAGGPDTPDMALLSEVAELGRTITSARQNIAALRVDEIRERDIPFATGELDAIVAHTANATNGILESCELLDQVGDDLDDDSAARVRDAVTRIYEACSFQDLTGQRISKVVGALKMIETKIARIIVAFGARTATLVVPPEPLEPRRDGLLNGPQLPSIAMDQSEIDRLLAGA